MLRQRDGALLATVEALLEASVAERVLKCLRYARVNLYITCVEPGILLG